MASTIDLTSAMLPDTAELIERLSKGKPKNRRNKPRRSRATAMSKKKRKKLCALIDALHADAELPEPVRIERWCAVERIEQPQRKKRRRIHLCGVQTFRVLDLSGVLGPDLATAILIASQRVDRRRLRRFVLVMPLDGDGPPLYTRSGLKKTALRRLFPDPNGGRPVGEYGPRIRVPA